MIWKCALVTLCLFVCASSHPFDAQADEPPNDLPAEPSNSATAESATQAPAELHYPTPHYPEAIPRELLSPTDASKLRTLKSHFDVLAELGNSHVMDGSLSIAAGGVFFTIAMFIDDNLVRMLLATTGAVAAGRGAILLTAAPDGQTPARAFASMPMTTAQDVVARLAFGEAALGSLAKQSRRARLLDGSLSMLAGAAFTPIYFALQRRDDPDYRFADDPSDYIGIALSAVSFTSGLITVVRKSEAEQRHDSYLRMREAFARQARSWLPRLAFHATRDSVNLAARLRF